MIQVYLTILCNMVEKYRTPIVIILSILFVVICMLTGCTRQTEINDVKQYTHIGNTHGAGHVYTSLEETPEGIYRVFVFNGYYSGGITAIKIK